MPSTLEQLQVRIGYTFKDATLLSLAMTHASCRQDGLRTNQRMELLGDKLAGLIITEAVYQMHPDYDGRRISGICMRLLNNANMSRYGEKLRLIEHVHFGKGLRRESKEGSAREGILADAFEALIAAVYLDGGFDAAKTFILRVFANDLNEHHS